MNIKLASSSNCILVSFIASLFIAISAQITIPWFPVPFTLQTAAIFFIACTLPLKMALMSITMYLVEGMLGLPVFSNFYYGIGTILGVKGGYILAFLPATFIACKLNKINSSFLSKIFSGFVFSFIILTIGTIWLGQFIGVKAAFQVGFLPFVFSDIIKIISVSVITNKLNKCKN
ncbi:MAG: biotin transporter BioY [Alphaproteobacteria bacterium]|nr:biotin transporter BioY [Alphaproteobacteria bacterium]